MACRCFPIIILMSILVILKFWPLATDTLMPPMVPRQWASTPPVHKNPFTSLGKHLLNLDGGQTMDDNSLQKPRDSHSNPTFGASADVLASQRRYRWRQRKLNMEGEMRRRARRDWQRSDFWSTSAYGQSECLLKCVGLLLRITINTLLTDMW